MTIRDTDKTRRYIEKMRSTIRSATLTGYAELEHSIGLDPHRLMRPCGLNPSCRSDPDLRVDAAEVAKLLETSAAESHVEDFGLRLSTARRLSNLGPFSMVVREETTARRILETLLKQTGRVANLVPRV